MAPEHAQSIMWNEHDEPANDGVFYSNVGSARIINCIVDRATDQEESINVRKGFRVGVASFCRQMLSIGAGPFRISYSPTIDPRQCTSASPT